LFTVKLKDTENLYWEVKEHSSNATQMKNITFLSHCVQEEEALELKDILYNGYIKNIFLEIISGQKLTNGQTCADI